MAILIVLVAAWLLLRSLGAFGLTTFATWHGSARYALAVMFGFTGTAHFNQMRHDLARMIPAFFPQRLLLVYLTGILEFLGALGLLWPRFRSLAGICLMALLAGMFVANVHAARSGVRLRGKPVTPLWLRTPMQIGLIFLLWWSSQT
jgi:uncharacterized membrane protein